MQSRVRTVIPPEKKQPSVFKSLCLPNTGFMVDFLGFFTRDDFEKYLQLTCKRMNQLILTHFHSKPYRYLDNVTLNCNLVLSMGLCLKKQTTVHSVSRSFWDPHKLQWDKLWIHYVGFSKMRQFLDKTVRVPKVIICISESTTMKQKNIDQLKSLSHIWENSEVEKLMESDKAQSFRIVFAVDERFKLSDDDMDNFRYENNREVLQFRIVPRKDVAKFCEIDMNIKYFILERSLA
ncbi:hypothetical protein Ddc_15475 [Ditylenchus destructor]|nr:hypothetical protein Ddc_15475 [Ditylenchus destructor]